MSKAKIALWIAALFTLSIPLVVLSAYFLMIIYMIILGLDSSISSLLRGIINMRIIAILAAYALSIFLWIKTLKMLKKEILEEKIQRYLGIMIPVVIVALVVAILVFFFSYFGLVQNNRPPPDSCMATSGFACIGRPITESNMIAFTVMNDIGYDITLSNANTTLSNPLKNMSCDGIYLCPQGDITCTSEIYNLKDNSGTTIRVYGCDFKERNLVKGEITITYVKPESILPEKLIVSIIGKVTNSKNK